MKAVLFTCFLVITVLSGCKGAETTPLAGETWKPSMERIELAQSLQLQENQTVDVLDYRDSTALCLVADRAKRNPADSNDQVATTFYESFVLYDLSSRLVTAEFPVQQFGICTGALSVYGGVLFSFFTVGSDETLDSSLYFLDDGGDAAHL